MPHLILYIYYKLEEVYINKIELGWELPIAPLSSLIYLIYLFHLNSLSKLIYVVNDD